VDCNSGVFSELINEEREFRKKSREIYYAERKRRKDEGESLEELCKMFGHDVDESAYEKEYVRCRCCNKRQKYGSFIPEWDAAPLRRAIFERPVVEGEPRLLFGRSYDPEERDYDD
jgi:hypothetical protein